MKHGYKNNRLGWQRVAVAVMVVCAANGLFAQMTEKAGEKVAESQTTSSLDALLDEIEQHNTFLKATKDTYEAERAGNKTGLNLSDPQVDFAHSWYNKGGDEREIEFTVTQELDWGVLTGRKKRTARQKNNMLDLQYRTDRNTLRLKALQELLTLIYCDAVLQEWQARLTDARTLSNAYAELLGKGSVNQIEYNRTKLYCASMEAGFGKAETERQSVIDRLKALNGGQELVYAGLKYDAERLPENFEDWLAQAEEANPQLRYMKETVDLSRNEMKLVRTENLPNLTVGYTTEQSPIEGKHGLVLGVSLPLWQNRNKMKQSKAAVVAAQSREADVRMQFYNEVAALYRKAQSLRRVADEYRQALETLNTPALLRKALDEGQINVLDYTTEMIQYNEACEQALAAELDYQLVWAELRSYAWS